MNNEPDIIRQARLRLGALEHQLTVHEQTHGEASIRSATELMMARNTLLNAVSDAKEGLRELLHEYERKVHIDGSNLPKQTKPQTDK